MAMGRRWPASARSPAAMALVLLLFLRYAAGLAVTVTDEECIYEYVMYEGDNVSGNFVVVDHDIFWNSDHPGIDFTVTSPSGNIVHTLKGTSGDKFEFNAPRGGMYKFCFHNPYSTPETVSFYVQGIFPMSMTLPKMQMVSVAFKNRSLVKISSGGRFQSSNLDIPRPLQKELRSNIRIDGCSGKNDKEINGDSSVDLLVDVMMERRFEGLGTESARFQAHTSPAGKKKSSSDCGHIEKKIKHRGFNSSINQCVPAPAMKILRWSFNDVIHTFSFTES